MSINYMITNLRIIIEIINAIVNILIYIYIYIYIYLFIGNMNLYRALLCRP